VTCPTAVYKAKDTAKAATITPTTPPLRSLAAELWPSSTPGVALFSFVPVVGRGDPKPPERVDPVVSPETDEVWARVWLGTGVLEAERSAVRRGRLAFVFEWVLVLVRGREKGGEQRERVINVPVAQREACSSRALAT
jgi:hypothetical protein